MDQSPSAIQSVNHFRAAYAPGSALSLLPKKLATVIYVSYQAADCPKTEGIWSPGGWIGCISLKL